MKDAKKNLIISITPDMDKAIDELRKTNKNVSKSETLRYLIALGISAANKLQSNENIKENVEESL